MKIKDEVKGIKDYPYSEVPEDYYDDDIDINILEEQHYELEQWYSSNANAIVDWEAQGEKNIIEIVKLQQLECEKDGKKEINQNLIGKRIEFLVNANKLEIAEFCRSAEISRCSYYRFTNGTNCPSVKTLRKIISAFSLSVADFCYEPTDFDKWKASFDVSKSENDIFKFRDDVLVKLAKSNFTYRKNDVAFKVPNQYFEIFRNLIKDAFDILDLLPHD